MKYLIIGDGRLAKHLRHYFSLLGLTTYFWSRKNSEEELRTLVDICDRVILLISDSALQNFLTTHPFLLNKVTLHMSGAVYIAGVPAAHPLNTFGDALYPLEIYQNTPFIVEQQTLSFHQLLPDLKNQHFTLPVEKKALYHSLCVMSGNFTTLLWQNIFQLFEERLQIPRTVLLPYLERIFSNLTTDPNAALTGPFSRGDWPTVIKNLDALRDTPEQNLYYAFLNYVLDKYPKKNELKNEYLKV